MSSVFDKKFNQLANQLKVKDDQLVTAYTFWNAGNRFSLKQDVSVSALLRVDELEDILTPTKDFMYKPELSSQEADILSKVLTGMINQYNAGKNIAKQNIQKYWLVCDKEDKNTEGYFKEMNKLKTTYRKACKQLKTIESAQRTLKAIAKGG